MHQVHGQGISGPWGTATHRPGPSREDRAGSGLLLVSLENHRHSEQRTLRGHSAWPRHLPSVALRRAIQFGLECLGGLGPPSVVPLPARGQLQRTSRAPGQGGNLRGQAGLAHPRSRASSGPLALRVASVRVQRPIGAPLAGHCLPGLGVWPPGEQDTIPVPSLSRSCGGGPPGQESSKLVWTRLWLPALWT